MNATQKWCAYVSYFSRDIYFENKKAMSLLGRQPQYKDPAEGIRELMGGDGEARP